MSETWYCEKCGKEFPTKEKTEEHEKRCSVKSHSKKSKLWWLTLGIIIGVVFVILLIFVIPFPYKAIEVYTEQQPTSATEYYNTVETGKGCDKTSACYCLHESWWGLGACDSCSCTRTRTVIKYVPVPKEREVQKTATLFQMWAGQVKWYYKV